jgi:hypothetical protein
MNFCSNFNRAGMGFSFPFPKASHSGDRPRTFAIRMSVECLNDLILPLSRTQIKDGETSHRLASSIWFNPALTLANLMRPARDASPGPVSISMAISPQPPICEQPTVLTPLGSCRSKKLVDRAHFSAFQLRTPQRTQQVLVSAKLKETLLLFEGVPRRTSRDL